jgi:hypothetical protein
MRCNTTEPSIEEMLADPIVRALMTADGVRAEELEALLHSIAKRLRAGAKYEEVQP